ncbi:MAG TPA: sigma-70 family RNA polymerase sigma factor [Puia sp.]|nr:sigma-70 family RNA polymerase sigma factor [Puia sp.]
MNNNIGNHPADQLLVNKVLNGDTHAFGEIIKNTEGLVAQIMFKMIPNTEDRKDIAQDIYLKAYSKLSGFRFQSKLSTWIGQITYNTCLNWLERKKLLLPGDLHSGKDTEHETGTVAHTWDQHTVGCEPETLILRKELSAMLQAGIHLLSPVYKTLIILYHQEELSYEEIVTITGLPEGTVKNYLFRARKALREGLLLKYKREEL